MKRTVTLSYVLILFFSSISINNIFAKESVELPPVGGYEPLIPGCRMQTQPSQYLSLGQALAEAPFWCVPYLEKSVKKNHNMIATYNDFINDLVETTIEQENEIEKLRADLEDTKEDIKAMKEQIKSLVQLNEDLKQSLENNEEVCNASNECVQSPITQVADNGGDQTCSEH